MARIPEYVNGTPLWVFFALALGIGLGVRAPRDKRGSPPGSGVGRWICARGDGWRQSLAPKDRGHKPRRKNRPRARASRQSSPHPDRFLREVFL